MRKIHKKHIIMMLAAAGGALVLGAGGFFYYQNNLSREAKIYAEEIKMLKNYIYPLPAEEKNIPQSVKVPILVYHGVGPFNLMATLIFNNFKGFLLALGK